MRDKAVYTAVSEQVSAHPVVTGQHSPCVIVFVAGEQLRVEAAIHSARQLYPNRHFVFICEPAHCAWLSQCSNDNVFVIEHPFNPFGQRASELRKHLEAIPIEACALVVADIGFESFRLRVFGLRLRTRRFVLLYGVEPGLTRQVGRFSFVLLAGAAFFLGRLRKLQNRIVRVYSNAGEFSALTEGHLMHAVRVQRSNGASRTGLRGRVESGLASLGIKYLDIRYRRIFEKLFNEQWEQWFERRDFSKDSITAVIGTLGPGGSERQAITTLLGVAARGYRDLAVLCTSLSTPTERFYADMLEGCPVSVSELSEGFRHAHRGDGVESLISAGLRLLTDKLPSELKDISWYAREFLLRRPQVIHAWLDYANVRAGLAAAIIGVPRIVLSTRSVAPNNFALFQPYMREAYRLLAKRPNVCLLNNSEAGARDYERWLGLPRGTFKVVRNGFDFSAFERLDKAGPAQAFRARLGIPPEAPLVGSVLRFSEEKRPLLWIDVAARVSKRRPEVMFLMVGDGPLREEARRHAQACGIGNRILMPGQEKDSAVAVAAMDLFLLTSRLEGLPNVLIEAQALGVPVVTTNGGGAAETLIQGRTGYAVFPDSADLLADTVLRLLGDAAWRMSARETAQTFVREQFSMSRMVDRTLDAYFARGEFGRNAGSISNDPGRVGGAILRFGA